MLQALKNTANRTYTENGAATHASTFNHCLDLFSTIGALRSASGEEVIIRFFRAFTEDPDLAMKILFFARDIRGGLGERRCFRLLLSWLAQNEPGSLRKNIPYIAEFGRWDDLLILLGTRCEKDVLALIRRQLDADLQAMEQGRDVSLLAKWLPSVNTSNTEAVYMAKRIARSLGLSDAAYRKTLSRLRSHLRILENSLRRKDYSFDYSRQPSTAMHKYRKAFYRNDGERYRAFLDRVKQGEAVLHTGTLTPYDIVAPLLRDEVTEEERETADVTWKALEDFTGDENALVVVDGSGSMYWGEDPLPAAVALSLGIYFAQRNNGTFHNHFITFSEHPQLVQIIGNDIYSQVRYCMSYNEVANTNLQRVFELILKAALENRTPQSEMPSTLYVISDMEFDVCTDDAGLTNFQYAKTLFERHGYRLPRVVFWNVNSRNSQYPVTENEQGVALVSGCSPRIFQMLSGGTLTPMDYMLDILSAPRYQKIAA